MRFFRNTFFVNNDDSDGDGVIDQFDSDSNDIYSDSDLDGVSDLMKAKFNRSIEC